MAGTTIKPLVLVVSGAGVTGLTVLKGLARSGAWVSSPSRSNYRIPRTNGFFSDCRQRLAATVRPTSIDKPEVAPLRELGVDVRPCDWQKQGPAELDELFSGVDIVISTTYWSPDVLLDQKMLVDAAKRMNVKRFIPNDFGTPAPPGVMMLQDTVGICIFVLSCYEAYSDLQKSQIRKYIKEQDIPYTFIDVGFWMQISVPYRPGTPGVMAPLVRGFYGDGNTKSAVTNKDHIGDFVARIIADPRTLNQHILVHEDEVSQNEIYEVCNRVTGEDFHKYKEPVRTSTVYLIHVILILHIP